MIWILIFCSLTCHNDALFSPFIFFPKTQRATNDVILIKSWRADDVSTKVWINELVYTRRTNWAISFPLQYISCQMRYGGIRLVLLIL